MYNELSPYEDEDEYDGLEFKKIKPNVTPKSKPFMPKGDFTSVEKYMGPYYKEGYIYKNDLLGLGYYKDNLVLTQKDISISTESERDKSSSIPVELPNNPRSEKEKEEYKRELRDRVLANKIVREEKEKEEREKKEEEERKKREEERERNNKILKEKYLIFREKIISMITTHYNTIEEQVKKEQNHTIPFIFKFISEDIYMANIKYKDTLKIIKEINNSGIFKIDVNYIDDQEILRKQIHLDNHNIKMLGIYFNWGESDPEFLDFT